MDQPAKRPKPKLRPLHEIIGALDSTYYVSKDTFIVLQRCLVHYGYRAQILTIEENPHALISFKVVEDK